jgi:hypothetical protein
MTLNKIRITLRTILVGCVLILGLAYTSISAYTLFENGGHPPRTAVAYVISFGLFLTITLTVIVGALMSLVQRGKA